MNKTTRRVGAFLIISAMAHLVTAHAEPYFAVQKGLHCSACHSNPAGGGKRNVYGNVFSQQELAAERVGGANSPMWTGNVNDWLAIGANLRGRYEYIDTPNQDETSEFDVTRATVYVEANVIPNRLTVYVDQQVAPGSSINREAYARLRDKSGKWHLTGGQFYLPYGLRLQDDTAFVRQVTGINFTTPDRGVQVGYESGPWSTMLAVTNGTGGGAEIDTGKQASFIATYVKPGWRAGVSLNNNDADAGDRQMQNVFFGLRTGPIAWLAEVDWIKDDLATGGELDGLAGLIEGNWSPRKGHNLKLSHEYFDPDVDTDEDHQARWSLVWEYSPMQFVQSRFGIRLYDGIPQVDTQNRDVLFLELHGFF